MRECLKDSRLKWFGHLERMEKNASKCTAFKASGSGRLDLGKHERGNHTWLEEKVSKDLAKERNAWKSSIRNRVANARM